MNAVAEALGLSLPGCAAIPAPYRERGQMAYATGRRIVEMAFEDLRPSRILTRQSFLNALSVVSCAGGSSNAQVHIMAMARHAGVDLQPQDWTTHGYDLPLLLNMQPAVNSWASASSAQGACPR
jgi:dihydroxyacid dehydratase/phosphogluconate dehydratase